jgi:flagellar assembly factor FliW
MTRSLTTPSPASPTPEAEAMVVEFPAGIPGFEAHRRFVLVASPDLTPLGCLKSFDSADVSFLVIDPSLVHLDYDRTLSAAERARVDAAADDALLWLAIVTLSGKTLAANLRAPIVINPRTMTGCQVIRDTDRYPVRFEINLG